MRIELFSLFLLAACVATNDKHVSGDEPDTDADSDTDTGADTDTDIEPACDGVGFDTTPTTWALPAARYHFDGADTTWEIGAASTPNGVCDDGSDAMEMWTTTDLTGDGVPDFVVTRDDCGPDGLGDTFWEVYPGGASGFAATPIEWTLPAARYHFDGADTTWEIGAASTPNGVCDDGSDAVEMWTTTDLTGDGVPDFVVTRDDCGPDGLGDSFWEVYAGGASGFAATPIEWTLPAARYHFDGADTTWEIGAATTPNGVCDDGSDAVEMWTTRDLTGDGVPDFVVTRDDCGPDGLGDTFWEVYPGGASGFAATPIEWTLPAARYHFDGADTTWEIGAASTPNGVCDDGAAAWEMWTTTDLTGDDVPDFVVTRDDCGPDGLGDTFWEVYPGGASGFAAAPIEWTLPDARYHFEGADTTWEIGAASTPNGVCDDGAAAWEMWTTTDLTGDGVPDFVVTRDDCGPGGLGDTFWEVYAGGASGFAAAPIEWTLPDARYHFEGADTTWEIGAASTPNGVCDDGAAAWEMWTTRDLTGDGVPDFVVTRDDCGPDGLGDTFWEVYAGVCE